MRISDWSSDVCSSDLQDLLAPVDVGTRHHDLAVETARPQQRGVQHVRPVGGGDDDDAFIGVKAVHLHQKLVQRLLALVIAVAQPCAAMTSHGVDRSEEHTSELQSLMRISYAVFCLKKKLQSLSIMYI